MEIGGFMVEVSKMWWWKKGVVKEWYIMWRERDLWGLGLASIR
jgi:hypothetical protein